MGKQAGFSPFMLVIGVGILLLFGVAFMLLSQAKPTPQPVPSTPPNTTARPRASLKPTVRPSVSPSAQASAKMTTSTYSITYPATWQRTYATLNGGGNILTLTAPGDMNDFPIMLTIQAIPANSQNAQTVTTAVKSPQNSSKPLLPTDPSNAERFAGTIPFSPLPQQQGALLFQNGQTLYAAQYQYRASSPQPGVEAMLNTILGSIKLF